MTTYLTYQDIADLTGIPKGTLRQWRARGKLPEPDYMPPRPTGSTMPLWSQKVIEEWWKEQRVQVRPN